MVLENVKILLCIFTWMSKYLEHLISQCHNFDYIKLNQISDFEYICLFSINYTSTKSWKSYIFIAVCLYVYVCMCVCVCLCVCVCVCLSVKKFRAKECTDLDAVFTKWLHTTLTRTLFKYATLGQRSRLQWRNIIFFLYNTLLTFLLCI